MTFAAAVGLLLLLAGAWIGGSYLGLRRGARSRQSLAEHQVRTLTAEIGALRHQVEAERTLLERLPEPVILVGPDRGIIRLNVEARSTLGPGAPALLRMPAFRAAIDSVLNGAGEASADLALSVPIARELHVRVVPTDGAQGQVIALLSDRTRERAIEQMRSDFVANASHELRTPLASLIGFIDTLRGPAADDKAAQTRFLGIMAEQAQRMNRLIDDLLSLSRIELTEHLAPSGRVDLATLIGNIAASLDPLFTARQVTLKAAIEPGLPQIVGDEDQLRQVLQNLIENAIKYGRDGGVIHIGGRAAPHGRTEGVTFNVRDEGAGIPAIHIPRLTERFYRVNTRRSRAVGGTGLGLAIVKHIVNRHRGHMRIESAEGSGTTVIIWLPTSREPAEPARV